MAKFSRVAGSTSQSVNIFIQDSASTTGAGKTGLVYNSAGAAGNYTFSGANAALVACNPATIASLATAWTTLGFIEIGHGLYRYDLPNASLASSKGNTVTFIIEFTGAAPCVFEIELTAIDNQVADSARTIGTVTTVTNQLTAAQVATGVWTDTTAGDFTVASSVGKSVMNGVALGTGLTINGYTGNTPQTGDSYSRIGAAGAGLTGITGVTLAASQPELLSRLLPQLLTSLQQQQ